MSTEIAIHCLYDELIDPKKLKDYEKNPNKHGSDQIERLAEIYKYQGIRHPIIVDPDRKVIAAGHGRKLAAIRAGIKAFPVVYQKFDSDEQFYAFVTSDNAVALWADLDLSAINAQLPDLSPDFDIDMLGIKDFQLNPGDLDSEDGDNPYTRKVESPIYEPTGEKPKLTEVYDDTKTKELHQEIDQSSIDEDLKQFLKLAAYRHTKYNYKYIAELYAHLGKEEQRLFENSALVVIDFDRAIELGFVKMTEAMREAYEDEI